MFSSLYIEDAVSSHPLVETLCKRFNDVPHIPCKHYGEIFNRSAQDFRVQKKNPSLILAKKHGKLVLPTPKTYGIGSLHNYYFSHMLNCLFDCRYCFLQGMFKSANYVFFVNFEDFKLAIQEKIQEHSSESITFFSGYDCDSLALEPITHFAQHFLPFFASIPATLELRTKSTQIQTLLKNDALSNCIIAFTLSPKEIANALEHKAPPLHRRLDAMQKLQDHNWPLGLRFDPLIYCSNYQEIYSLFFKEVFSKISYKSIHSITFGPFRLPKNIYKNIFSLYPDEKLFAHSLEERANLISYKNDLEEELIAFCRQEIVKYVPEELLYSCRV